MLAYKAEVFPRPLAPTPSHRPWHRTRRRAGAARAQDKKRWFAGKKVADDAEFAAYAGAKSEEFAHLPVRSLAHHLPLSPFRPAPLALGHGVMRTAALPLKTIVYETKTVINSKKISDLPTR
jgi:hypothetical protein